ncbi:hypothetical protein ACVWWG_005236 [Bradyrhizobium sp. LB7.2]
MCEVSRKRIHRNEVRLIAASRLRSSTDGFGTLSARRAESAGQHFTPVELRARTFASPFAVIIPKVLTEISASQISRTRAKILFSRCAPCEPFAKQSPGQDQGKPRRCSGSIVWSGHESPLTFFLKTSQACSILTRARVRSLTSSVFSEGKSTRHQTSVSNQRVKIRAGHYTFGYDPRPRNVHMTEPPSP